LRLTVRLLAVLLVSLALLRPAIAAEKRVALVVGNGDYGSVSRLPNPANDATLIAETLKGLGFTLIGGGAQTDLDKTAMTKSIEAFGRALIGADVALFYYSGHGLQVQGVNWLVPIDANPTRTQDLDFQMVDADLVLHQMDGARTRLNIVILDACRNNPFAISGLRNVGSGLAEMRAPEGTLISYATQPGAVAADGDGSNSPYTLALAAAMRQPGQDVFRTFNNVGLAVKRATGGEQQPWVSNSPIDGDFSFAGPVRPAIPVAPIPAVSESPRPAAVMPQPAPPPEGSRTTEAASRPVAPQPTAARPARAMPRKPAQSGRCSDLVARAQLGEPLSAADRAATASCGF
jgi:Caspase domain